MKHIILLLLAVLPILQIRSQENLSLGTIVIPFSEEIELSADKEGDMKTVCFTLNENADIELCLDQAEGDNCLTLFDQEEDYVTDNVNNNSTGNPLHTKTFQNLPAGSYQISIESIDVKYIKLTIRVTEANFKKSAKDLGRISCASSFVEDVDLTNKYNIFHGHNMCDGMAIFCFETTVPLELSASLCATSESDPKIIFGSDKAPYMYQVYGDGSSVSSHVDELKENIYYMSVGSNGSECALVLNLDFTALKSDSTIIAEKSDSTMIAELYGKYNYIIQRSFTKSDGSAFNDQVTYYDEMGREQECIQKKASPTEMHDLVTLKEYDDYGKLEKEWLAGSLSTNDGSFMPIEEAKSVIMDSNGQDSAPFALKHYEESPRNLLVEEYGPGQNWHEGAHANIMSYGVNIKDDTRFGCFHYSVEGKANTIQIMSHGQYSTGVLTVKIYKDEDGRYRYEFIDEQEHVVLSRKFLDDESVDTYYIYDVWGNLQAVLPPMASSEMYQGNHSWSGQESFIAQYAYLFAYDESFRKNGSKVPGCDWVYVMYDNADTPVFTQNGEQREKGEWSFVISDVWGRPCLEGVCKNALQVGTSLPNTSAVYDGTSANYGYSINGVDLNSPVFHKITFYDKYDFIDNSSLGMSSLAYSNSQDAGYNTMSLEGGKGKVTGCITAIDGQMDKAIKTVCYYDYRGRNIQTNSTNNLGGTDKLYKAYDFTNNCIKQRQVHTATGKNPYTTDLAYTYDHAGRLLKTTMSVNNCTPMIISNLEYDELGRLIAEKRNGNDKLRTTYDYNIRQWTTAIKGNLFTENLYYNEGHNGATGFYGGNVSSMDWSTGDKIGKVRGYGFNYDKLDRLNSASYYEDDKKSDNYSTTYAYDLMGNMQSMTKQGLLDDKTYGKVDDLAYTYNGNQVIKITDKVSGPYYKDAMHFVDGANADIEYEYDKNGCMTKDLNKNISKIEYNLLNLPTKLTFSDGSIINYSYDANGTKLGADYNLSLMNVMNGTSSFAQTGGGVSLRRDYCGNFIYEDRVLKMMLFDGGYVTFTSNNTPEYHFYIKDHLGNNRVVADANGNIEQVNHYYPFGGLMAESTGCVQSYKYNGKELDRMHGLDSYDYGARWMCDGRFTTPDPHAIDYTDVSPYVYCGNNPMNAIDVNGEDIYKIDDNGYVSLAQMTKDSQDRLYYGNSSISLNKGILSQLTVERSDYNGNYAISGNLNDMTKLFVFVANNTAVEWGLDASSKKSKISYNIRTTHERNSVSPYNVKNDKNLLFTMHSHSKNSNSHKASGADVSHIKSGQTIEGYYDFGDVGRYATMINNFQRVHKGLPFSKLPKAYVYDASGKPQPQLFQYTHKRRNFNNQRIYNYKQLTNLLRK